MIKVSSRFLAVLMLAVLAFTDITTTSAFAQRGAVHIRPAVPELRIRPAVPELRIRPPGIADVPWRNPMTPGRVLEDFGLDSRSGGHATSGLNQNGFATCRKRALRARVCFVHTEVRLPY